MGVSFHHGDATEPGDALGTYLDELGAYTPLTSDLEAALARRIRGGDRDAVDTLVCANLRFVVSVAKRFRQGTLPLADLIAEGNLGLIRAAERFDERRGVRFISYAVWWIRQAIIQALVEQSRPVRLPMSMGTALYRVGRRADALAQELGHEPSATELADAVEPEERQAAAHLALLRPSLSFDAPVSTERENVTLAEMLPDEHAPSTDHDAAEDSRHAVLEGALARLRPRERHILALHFGLDGNEPMTLEAIGAMLGITRERVRQIKEKALWRMRVGRNRDELAACNE